MSLLLEALKKAEKAKEEAQRRARGESELRLEAEPATADAKTVMTRAELPDIRQPLEILSEEIAAKEPRQAPVTEKALPAAQPQPHRQTADKPQTQAAERATAKKVFEAKFREPNPRLPFYVVLGVLGFSALGTAGYFWYQLRPPPALVSANPQKTGNPAPPPAAEAKPAAAPLAATPAAIPGLPASATPPTQAASPAPQAKAADPAPAAGPKPAAKPSPRLAQALGIPAAAPAAPVQREASVSTSRAAPVVHPKVESGYAAYLAGELAAARADYQQALREDSGNRDALLGLAAIDVRSGRHESAEATYLRLLQVDPNDAHAQAGLIALRSARLDPLLTESRVKTMLAADPGANVLHFTLGNQLAQQGRWAEAQQEYFKAFAAEPENADFAYNLAVSLDHLRQTKPALEHYRRAIALAEKRGASFDLSAARTRAAQLAR